MVSDEGAGSRPTASMVKIYVARDTFEAQLIRRTLAAHGIACMIPGDEMDAPGGGLEANAVLVPTERRDEALGLLEEAWAFYEDTESGPPADDSLDGVG